MMTQERIEAFRRRLREGQPVRVVNGEVVEVATPPVTSQGELTSQAVVGGLGGTPPAPQPEAGFRVKPHEWGAAPFFLTPQGEARVWQEVRLLQHHYPSFRMEVEDDGTPVVHGWIGPTETLRRAYQVLLVLPPDYGTGAMPAVHVLEPVIEQAPHQFTDGSLCLDHSGAFTARSTLVTLLAWVSVWLVLYEGWVETGEAW